MLLAIECRSVPSIAFYDALIPAGFPSPAADYVEGKLDLNDLIKRPAATFAVRVSGCSMTRAGLMDGSVVLVDRSITPKPGDVVVAVLDGEMTVKRLLKRNGSYILAPDCDDPLYRPIALGEHSEMVVWGVVYAVITVLGAG